MSKYHQKEDRLIKLVCISLITKKNKESVLNETL